MPELDSARAALQADVLRAVLAGRPVPGAQTPARLADLALTRDEAGAARLLREGLAEAAAARLTELTTGQSPSLRLVDEPPGPLAPAGSRSLAAVLRVRGPQAAGDRADVAVDVCTVHDERLHPLETVTVGYERRGDRWVLVSGPATLAT